MPQKNQTTLLKFPSYNKNYIYDVPEGVETIKTGAIEVFYMMKKKGQYCSLYDYAV